MNKVAVFKTAVSSGNDRAELIQRHIPLVKRIAYHLMCRLPPNIQLDDLIQSGMVGLVEASLNYDQSHGASFETYAGIRIRGAILDEIRKGGWAPRSLHRKLRQLAKVVQEIEADQGRDARDAEVAERLGITLDEYYQVLQDANRHRIFSLEEVVIPVEEVTEGLTGKSPCPLENTEYSDFKKALAKAISSLPERERLVLSLYYDEEINLREIGEVLGVSESRVCQIHVQALIRLRARMSEWI